MEPSTRDALTIGQLAHTTGVPIATLRSWESRYGFPRPERLPGGHRRYDPSVVEAVLEVLERRKGGLSLSAAVQRVAGRPVAPASVFAELRRTRPAITPQLLSRGAMVALSRAIEDECCARAADPVLFGAFQHERNLHPSYARWLDLARTARSTVVFAEFDRPAPVQPTRPVEVAVPTGSVLQREWMVVCDAPDLPACLTAVELPGQDGRRPADRRFEALWSVDPQVVRQASRVAASLADQLRPEWRTTARSLPDDDPAGASADLERASQLFNRMLGYLDASGQPSA